MTRYLEPNKPADQLITLAQAARMAGMSYAWAYARARGGRLEVSQAPNGRIRVTASSVVKEICAMSPRRRPRLQVIQGGRI
jgi:predicted site-specific integrase-resolvase